MARGKFKALREEPAEDGDVDGEYDEEDQYYEEDEEDEGAVEGEYEDDDEAEYEEEAEYEDAEEAEYDDEDSAEAEDESEDEYEEDEYYDEDEDAEYEDEPEPYRPPTAIAAIKDAFTNRSRRKARPASDTAEDAQAVNYVNGRERALGFFLGFSLIALGILVYFSDKHATRATLKYPATGTLTTAQQANLVTIHAAAGKDLIVYAALGALIVIATFWKRRAAIAFTVLFAGLALFFTGDILGILYLGVGGWMIFKVRKQTKEINTRARAGSRPPATRPSRSGRATPATTATASTTQASRTSTSEPRQIGKNKRQYSSSSAAAAASKRYTPPKPVRRPVPTVQPEPEPSNRLTAWLRK